jgi:cell wall-associated NlpC family hydrolase
MDAFRGASAAARAADAQLQAARKQAEDALTRVSSARSLGFAARQRVLDLLSQVRGQQAATQAQVTAAATPRSASFPVGQGAATAVAAAKSRVGYPYVWGASGPSAFDCSGLTMWAWAQAGVSLPHFSGGQYADIQHISISAIQPGDLVFPSSPGSHEAMYIGGGMIVEAPHSGATVRITPLRSEFVLAGRP